MEFCKRENISFLEDIEMIFSLDISTQQENLNQIL